MLDQIIKFIRIEGYWATSISAVRTTIIPKKVIKTDLFSDFGYLELASN